MNKWSRVVSGAAYGNLNDRVILSYEAHKHGLMPEWPSGQFDWPPTYDLPTLARALGVTAQSVAGRGGYGVGL